MKRSRRGDLNVEQDAELEYESRAVKLSDISTGAKKAKRENAKIQIHTKHDNSPSVEAGAVGEVRVYAIEASGEEGCVRVCCELLDSAAKVSITVTVGQLAGLKISKGLIGKEEYEALVAQGEIFRAIRQGMTFLSYGDKSEKMLTYKLRGKGFDREVAESAVRYFVENGFLCEDDGAERLAALCVKKYWGRMRIRSELIAKGYSSEAVSAALETVEDVDFTDLCVQLINKKYRTVQNTPDGRRRLSAALARYGYSYGEIRGALEKFFC
ncbi:MAG: regulatory protein RecX [Ruminococcaceae bacterium]|nr:regulatory protein RecX [Oscillospiraceae bacterium]